MSTTTAAKQVCLSYPIRWSEPTTCLRGAVFDPKKAFLYLTAGLHMGMFTCAVTLCVVRLNGMPNAEDQIRKLPDRPQISRH